MNKLILAIKDDEIEITGYSTLDVTRNNIGLSITVTNAESNFMLNRIYDSVTACMARTGEKAFKLTIESANGSSKMIFLGMTANYYFNSNTEMLSFVEYKENVQQDAEQEQHQPE